MPNKVDNYAYPEEQPTLGVLTGEPEEQKPTVNENKQEVPQ